MYIYRFFRVLAYAGIVFSSNDYNFNHIDIELVDFDWKSFYAQFCGIKFSKVVYIALITAYNTYIFRHLHYKTLCVLKSQPIPWL